MNNFLAFSSLPELAFLFLISFVLGAFVGIQKDVLGNLGLVGTLSKKQTSNDFAGIRSFGLVAFFGALMQYIDQILGSYILLTVL